MTDEISIFRKIWSLGNYHKLAVEHQIVSEHLVAESVVRAGQTVLDLAAGSGNTTIAASRRRAHVVASDIVPEALEVTRHRLAAEQLNGADFHCGDTSSDIPFPNDAFDTVLSTLGASFYPDHQRAIDEMLRVTKPGGTIGIALWSEASMPSDVFRAGQNIKKGATESDRIQPAYRLCNGAYLRSLIGDRATSIRIVTGVFESCFETMDDYVGMHCENHPPAILRLSAYSEEQRANYRETLSNIAMRYNRATDGSLAICMDYTLLIIIKDPSTAAESLTAQ